MSIATTGLWVWLICLLSLWFKSCFKCWGFTERWVNATLLCLSFKSKWMLRICLVMNFNRSIYVWKLLTYWNYLGKLNINKISIQTTFKFWDNQIYSAVYISNLVQIFMIKQRVIWPQLHRLKRDKVLIQAQEASYISYLLMSTKLQPKSDSADHITPCVCRLTGSG